MLDNSLPDSSNSQQAKQAMISMEHEQITKNMNFNEVYHDDPDAQRPLGGQPILVSKINLKPGPGGTQILCLHPEKGQGLELVFDTKLLHTFCKLLSDGVQKTDWDFECHISDYTMPMSRTAH